ncbi:anaerobic sulfite reductase subunit A [Halalkaliarchaeum desulfuricum]|uniref:Anaerobic sulfite reductase subunit A n=1 Tax=Halalkaliarchaeum desulfuricum TaxID=2055893 RepID=A0A343TLR8_9EURY|nr:4Fe-4S dicluster domain-containing protein [Halalkaliarchaeum desulfuricum]AUX10040.1 anaerobic sulfite reductase subunit A [Halalkaliarchaeum desulfuricum]
MKIIDKPEFTTLIDEKISSEPRDVVGVQDDGEKYVFDELETADDLALDYDVTMLSPKKYIMPQRETYLEYQKSNGDYEWRAKTNPEGKVIVGIHPYDLVAIEQLDKIFIDTFKDEPYRAKRENSLLIGVNMQKASETAFAGSMGTATTDSGYDLLLTELGDRYAIEIGTLEGKEFLAPAETRTARSEEIEEVNRIEEEDIPDLFENELEFSPDELPTVLEENYDNMEFWEDYSENCVSCGTCNLVCPTCCCFSVEMTRDLDGKGGKQTRRWDGCLLEDFAAVAGDENFREEKAERHRHRLMRKGRYIYERYGDIACIGCGRCTSECVPNVADPCDIYNKLKKEMTANAQ